MTEDVVAADLEAAVQALARLSRVLERAAAPLSLADYRALAAIVGGEERASRLASRLAVGKPAISATVDSLARRGLIARERVAGDQRAVALVATAEGAAAFSAAQQQMAARLETLASAAGDGERGIRWLGAVGAAVEAQHAQRIQRGLA